MKLLLFFLEEVKEGGGFEGLGGFWGLVIRVGE
jgi:hypothetical protein